MGVELGGVGVDVDDIGVFGEFLVEVFVRYDGF